MHYLKRKFLYDINRVAVNMHRRATRIGNVQGSCLKVDQAAAFIHNLHPLHFMKAAYLQQGLKQYTQLILLR